VAAIDAVAVREALADEDEGSMPETHRRCIVTGEVRSKAELIRFVVSPEGRVVPDLSARLPGRGLWLLTRRDIVAQAAAKRSFARAARRPVLVDDGLDARIEAMLAERCRDAIGLARRAGEAQMGFVKVERLLRSGGAGLLLTAADGASDGAAKLQALAFTVVRSDALTAAELGAEFGREHVVHVALRRGPLAEALAVALNRLKGFRAV
jgi:uncharacterized protein